VVITFTDGTQLTSPMGVLPQLNIPPTSFPGSWLTLEPFRWDQRIFNIIFRSPKQGLTEAEVPIMGMASVTGGKSFPVTSYTSMLQCIDGMLGLTKSGPCPTLVLQERGVVVEFQEIPSCTVLLSFFLSRVVVKLTSFLPQ